MSVFQPLGATVLIDVSGTTQSVAVDADGGSSTVRVMNNGSATVWVSFGTGSATAVVDTSLAVGPGQTAFFAFPGTHAAAIAAGTTGKVYFTPGAGG